MTPVAAPPGDIPLALKDFSTTPSTTPRTPAPGVGGFRGPAAPCRRPQGTTPKRNRLKGSQASASLQDQHEGNPELGLGLGLG